MDNTSQVSLCHLYVFLNKIGLYEESLINLVKSFISLELVISDENIINFHLLDHFHLLSLFCESPINCSDIAKLSNVNILRFVGDLNSSLGVRAVSPSPKHFTNCFYPLPSRGIVYNNLKTVKFVIKEVNPQLFSC